MRKILLITGIVLASLAVLAVIAGLIANEPRPEGKPGPAADALAHKMQAAVNIAAWDSTRYVRWSFPRGHHFFWDRQAEQVQVKWDDMEVLLSTDGPVGKVWEKGQPLSGEAAEAALQKAWAYFCNDSFWLNAPAKVFDPGTKRSLVQAEDGREALLVEYESGGVTPGDAYLWLLDEDGLPEAYKMWVSIIPVGGIKATWEGWIELSTGAKIAASHLIGPSSLVLENISGGNRLSDVGLEKDPFERL